MGLNSIDVNPLTFPAVNILMIEADLLGVLNAN